MRRFADRREAGAALARALAEYRGRNPLVLAIPRGAVPMGAVVAEQLEGELDVVLVRKLGAPWNPEFAVGAVSEDGATLVDEDAATAAGADRAYLEEERATQLARLRTRRMTYTPLRPPVDPAGRVVIVLDDGVATGSTMVAALRAVRARGPAELVAATAVAPPSALAKLRAEADRVVVLLTHEPFYGVGRFFDDFTQVEDDEVARVLARAARPRSVG